MTVLKDVELHWCKLDPKHPVAPFGTPVWEAQIRTNDKAVAKEWKEAGINTKRHDEDDYFFANLKRKAIYEKTGDPAQPVVVVDGKLMPLDPTSIGNGSVANVQLFTKPYEYAGRKGIKVELKAIQVTKLVEYKASGGGNGLAFGEVGDTEVISSGEENTSEEDLW